MGPTERRQKMLEVLCVRRHDTYNNLASEFNVSRRTVRYDIEALICHYPIETVRGRYGGVKVQDGFYLKKHNSGPATLTPKQAELVERLRGLLTGDDLDTFDSILLQLAS